MAEIENLQPNEHEDLLVELTKYLTINRIARELKTALEALVQPDGNMRLHASQNDVLIEHSDKLIAILEERVKATHPELPPQQMSPRETVQFHLECVEHLRAMKDALLKNDASGEHLKSDSTTDANGQVITYLDPYIDAHLRKVAETIAIIPA